MGGKAKEAKGSAEDEARKKAEAINDTDDDEYKKTLRLECRALEKLIKNEEKLTGLFNDERLRINYFWLISKKELEISAPLKSLRLYSIRFNNVLSALLEVSVESFISNIR